jgi:hypothetical protein
MKLSAVIRLLLGGLLLLTSGCATITRGTKDTLVVESEPAGAAVWLSSGQSGWTPTSFKLPRKHPVVVTIQKAGYETLTVNVNPQISGAGAAGMAGNVLVGGLVGAVVDPMSGAMKDLRPNPIKVTLVPLKTGAPVPAPVPNVAPDPAPGSEPAPMPVVPASAPVSPPAAAGPSAAESSSAPVANAAPNVVTPPASS